MADEIRHGRWTAEEDSILRHFYATETRQQIAARLGRSEPSVRSRCWTLGLNDKKLPWSEAEVSILRAYYTERAGQPVYLAELMDLLPGRHRCQISWKAGTLGLTNHRRPVLEERKPRHYAGAFQYEAVRKGTRPERYLRHMEKHGSPRAGRPVPQEQLQASQRRLKDWWSKVSEEEKAALNRQATLTKVQRYGTGAPGNSAKNAYSRCKHGRRADLDNRFFRSSWEANYARYLNLLIEQRQIKGWEYEADTFVFHGVTQGVISYKPDFKVMESDGTTTYYEIKGWETSQDRTKFKRMAEHYPEVRLVVVQRKDYLKLEKTVAAFIKGWEYPGREEVEA